MDNKSQRKALQQIANDIVAALKKNAPSDSGKLKKSITGKVIRDQIEIDMLGYGVINDMGINGTERNNGSPFSFSKKRPPIDALKGFAKRKGLNVWALQESLFKKGYKGSNFIQKLNKEFPDYASNYADAVWADFAERMNKIK